MRASASPAGSLVTWSLALLFLALIDRALTSHPVLWAPTTFEDSRELGEIVFSQTYQAARAIYAPPPVNGPRVALLGNSRVWLTGRPSYLTHELATLAPDRNITVQNLGIFGAGIGDLEVLSRHLPRLDLAAVVVAIGTSDLLSTPSTPIAGLASQLLTIGWSNGPLPPASSGAVFDRWLRTLWPLYRFREFSRATLQDHIAPSPKSEPFPAHFATTRAVFDYMHGPQAREAESAYRAWRANQTLAGFVDYLRVGSTAHLSMVRERAAQSAPLRTDSPGIRSLDTLLARLSAGPWRTTVLIMPENPILRLDVGNEYHHPGCSDDAMSWLTTTAAAHGVRIVDARNWMPPEAFLDFDHMLPDLSGFQQPLSQEIVRAIGP